MQRTRRKRKRKMHNYLSVITSLLKRMINIVFLTFILIISVCTYICSFLLSRVHLTFKINITYFLLYPFSTLSFSFLHSYSPFSSLSPFTPPPHPTREVPSADEETSHRGGDGEVDVPTPPEQTLPAV